MKKVNTMRAKLLSTFVYEIDMGSMMRLILVNSPTCTSVWKCCVCDNSTTQKYVFIQLKSMNSDVRAFNENIAIVLIAMTQSRKNCSECNENAT